MMTLKRPTDEAILQMLDSVTDSSPTYQSNGIENAAPKGFDKDSVTFSLGVGQRDWELAKLAIEEWVMFPSELVSLVRRESEIQIGTTVAVLFRGLGIETINPARIVSVIDEAVGEVHRFGFTYVTLPDMRNVEKSSFVFSGTR